MFDAAEHYGDHLYPAKGENFENGVIDSNGNEVMDANEFERFTKTGVGSINLGETSYSQCELKDVSVDQFKKLPAPLQLEYVNTWFNGVTAEMLSLAIEKYSAADVFEFGEQQWQSVREDIDENQKRFFVEVEKALDWENGYLNWDNKVVTDINECQMFDEKEDAEDAASRFNITYGSSGRIYARVI
jgi:hypothetical protein